MSLSKKIANIILTMLLIVGFSSYILGAVEGMGGEVRLDYYDSIFKLRSQANQHIKEKTLISEERYVEIYQVVSDYAPLRDEYEEDVAYNLFEVYRFLVPNKEITGDRWEQAKLAYKVLDKSLFEAGFDVE